MGEGEGAGGSGRVGNSLQLIVYQQKEMRRKAFKHADKSFSHPPPPPSLEIKRGGGGGEDRRMAFFINHQLQTVINSSLLPTQDPRAEARYAIAAL